MTLIKLAEEIHDRCCYGASISDIVDMLYKYMPESPKPEVETEETEQISSVVRRDMLDNIVNSSVNAQSLNNALNCIAGIILTNTDQRKKWDIAKKYLIELRDENTEILSSLINSIK